MNKYWNTRESKQREKLIDKTISDIESKMLDEYREASDRIIDKMLVLYDKITKNKDKATVSDLYKFSKYYENINQMNLLLLKLGERQNKSMNQNLTNLYENTQKLIGKSINMTQIDPKMAEKAINSVWCSDGKHWSQRIWKNNSLLEGRILDDLIDCLVVGEPTSRLSKKLMDEFNVSFKEASRLIRTESAYVATKATADKYEEAGITKFEFLTAKDERTCSECTELDGKIFDLKDIKYGVNAVPIHPNCRCCILGVIDDNKSLK